MALWPINLYLKNTSPDFLKYIIPALLLVTSYILYTKNNRYYLIPILLIGIYEKKLLIVPVIFCFLDLITNFKKLTFTLLIISLTIFIWQYQSFKGQTVFNRDYEGEQLIIRNINLYPNIPMARLSQNKPKLYLKKASANFFALTDLNNYYFAGHPAPTAIANQELYKFFWPLVIFLILGVFHYKSLEHRNYILTLFISCILSLSILQNFDRNDFVLWFPISIITIHGIKKIF